MLWAAMGCGWWTEASAPLRQLLAASRISSLPTFIAAVFSELPSPSEASWGRGGVPHGSSQTTDASFQSLCLVCTADIFARV